MRIVEHGAQPLEALLEVRNLTVRYSISGLADHLAVAGVSFNITAGEVVGLMGESGCGKTSVAKALLGLLPSSAACVSGSVLFHNRDLLAATESELQKIRGARISVAFQEPGLALCPIMRVGDQIKEVIRAHSAWGDRRRREEAEVRLSQVGLSDTRRIYAAYPHQLSGGQLQRVVLAQALACQPELLIADEPTASLDACLQLELLALLRALKQKPRLAILLISHAPEIHACIADRLLVMHEGRILEQGDSSDILQHPEQSRTRTLLGLDLSSAVAEAERGERFGRTSRRAKGLRTYLRSCSLRRDKPASCDQARMRSSSSLCAVARPPAGILPPTLEEKTGTADLLLQVKELTARYVQERPFSRAKFTVQALDGVNLRVRKEKTLAIVGESGAGKSTLARCLAGLELPTSGEVWFDGRDFRELDRKEWLAMHRQIQLVFQDPASSFNPRLTAREIVEEPLVIQRLGTKAERRDRALELMEQVGILAQWERKLPLEFSGGQKQRLALARALALSPKLLILDEALTGQDLATRAFVLSLLRERQESQSLTCIHISHDLQLVSQFVDEVAVMHRGKVVEHGDTAELFIMPQHVQTRALLEAVASVRASPTMRPA